MNLSLRQTGGGLLLVPQFTLAADTGRGSRASFTPAAGPAEAAALFSYLRGTSPGAAQAGRGGTFWCAYAGVADQ